MQEKTVAETILYYIIDRQINKGDFLTYSNVIKTILLNFVHGFLGIKNGNTVVVATRMSQGHLEHRTLEGRLVGQ